MYLLLKCKNHPKEIFKENQDNYLKNSGNCKANASSHDYHDVTLQHPLQQNH